MGGRPRAPQVSLTAWASGRSRPPAALGTAAAAGELTACEAAQRDLFEPVKAAFAAPGPWLERLSAALGALLEAVAADPPLAERCLIDSRAIEVEGRRPLYRWPIEALAELMQGAREAGRELRGEDYGDPPPVAEEFCACGILAIVSMHLRPGETAALPALRGELVRLAATPFLGIDGVR